MAVSLEGVREFAGVVGFGGDSAGREVDPADGGGRNVDEDQLIPVWRHQHLVLDVLRDFSFSWEEDQRSQVVKGDFRLVDHD